MVPRIALEAWGVAPATGTRDARAIAAWLGVPVEMVADGFGLHGVYVGDASEGPYSLALRAARATLRRAAIDGEALDAVIYAGDALGERAAGLGAVTLAEGLGARDAETLDVFQTCSGLLLGFEVAATMASVDARLRRVLVAAGFRAPRSSPGFDAEALHVASWSTAGVAALLVIDGQGPELVSTEIRTDGTMSDAVVLAPGGTVSPDPVDDPDPPRGLRLDRPEALGEWMAERWLDAWAETALAALARASVAPEEVTVAALQFVPPARAEDLAEAIGVPFDRVVVVRDAGHAGPCDPLLALDLAHREGRLRDGDAALLLSSGTGFSWAASVLRWSAPRRPS